ncbi:hypothetical protein AVEN_119849-1 [Araneus ventricosus]|uniref:Uncharacterized protein n=1 Tax=Araneus ventricosus TaxID=182803 RepID=A0A4Y2GKG0_ARAVE|nr:hypothetical protein AVEN_119849-1 [Araneus ventricosus]
MKSFETITSELMNAWCYRLELRLPIQSYSKYRNVHSSLSAVEILLSPDNSEKSPIPTTSTSFDVSVLSFQPSSSESRLN